MWHEKALHMAKLSTCFGVNSAQPLADHTSSDLEMKLPEKMSEPVIQEPEDILDEYDKVSEKELPPAEKAIEELTKKGPMVKILWMNVIVLASLHIAALHGVYLMFISAMWQTNVFAFILAEISGIGVTAGAHRLWAHRSYKAKFPLRVFLAFLFTITFEKDIYDWAEGHRVHHKYSETDADPHNAKRGFFFSHIGWLMCQKHPEVIKKVKMHDFSDLTADPVVRFQRKFYLPLSAFCCFVLPTTAPMYLWGETFLNSLFIATFFRLCLTLNGTFLVNSAAHMFGNRPYDKNINPRDNILTILCLHGEGFHNFHHTFPFDYANSEYGIKFNIATLFIDVMAWLGLAYDRRTVSKESVKARKLRTGVNCNQATSGCGSGVDFPTKES